MNRLPSEILGEIFLHLDQDDKLQCMCVCRYWQQVIKIFALYHTIYVDSAVSLNKVISSMTKENANRVEQLVLSLYSEKEDIDLDRLLLLLSNLRRLYCTGPELNKLTGEKAVYPWQKKIQYIHEFSNGSVTSHLLQQGVCLNLTSLDIIDFYQNIIPLLKNAPALKRLTLSSGKMTFMELESIHTSAPHLESITLRGLTFSDDADVESMTIAPSISIKDCDFDELVIENMDQRIQLLVYISKKYRNLSSLTYTFASDTELHSDSGTDYLKQLPQNVFSRLKYLCIAGQIYWVESTFNVMNRCDYQLKTLRILKTKLCLINVAGSSKFSCVESLEFDTLLSPVNEFTWLKKFTALKKLKFSNMNYEIDLGDVLDRAPPTLESLSLNNVGWMMTDEDNRIYTNIKSLSFTLCTVLPDGSLNRYFPKLSKLKIKTCQLQQSSLSLSSMDLFRFLIAFDKDDTDDSILVVTKNERRRFAKRKQVDPLELEFIKLYDVYYPPVMTWLEHESDGEPRFTLYCNSLKNLVFE